MIESPIVPGQRARIKFSRTRGSLTHFPTTIVTWCVGGITSTILKSRRVYTCTTALLWRLLVPGLVGASDLFEWLIFHQLLENPTFFTPRFAIWFVPKLLRYYRLKRECMYRVSVELLKRPILLQIDRFHESRVENNSSLLLCIRVWSPEPITTLCQSPSRFTAAAVFKRAQTDPSPPRTLEKAHWVKTAMGTTMWQRRRV